MKSNFLAASPLKSRRCEAKRVAATPAERKL
jgi:hypothetical protein